jgi:hypothetical protein
LATFIETWLQWPEAPQPLSPVSGATFITCSHFTAALSPLIFSAEHVSADKSPLKGFGKASENAPNGETVLGRRASVRGESGAESRGPECQLQSSTLPQNGHREPAPGERDLGDIMPCTHFGTSGFSMEKEYFFSIQFQHFLRIFLSEI